MTGGAARMLAPVFVLAAVLAAFAGQPVPAVGFFACALALAWASR